MSATVSWDPPLEAIVHPERDPSFWPRETIRVAVLESPTPGHHPSDAYVSAVILDGPNRGRLVQLYMDLLEFTGSRVGPS